MELCQPLKELRCGTFKISEAVELEDILENGLKNANIITPEKLFLQSPEVKLNNNQLRLFLNGVKLKSENSDGIYRIYAETEGFIGLGAVKNKLLKRDFVI